MDKKNIIIGALIFAICVMSIGYAALSTTLTINGTATISQDWNVAITDIAVNTASSSAADTYTSNTATHTDTTATFDVTLKQPGAYVVYDIKIENKGTIAASRSVADLVPTITNPDLAIIEYSIVQQPATTLAVSDGASGGSDETIMQVKVQYKEGESLDTAQTAIDNAINDGTTGNPIQEKATIVVTYSQAS